MGAINWFLWIGGGVAIAAGVVLLTWAMLGDRIRGGRRKRRCPRCWYDMSGVPGLTCPECGREARNERRLHRTRRRWGWGAAAALAMAGGAALGLLGRYSAEVAPIVLPVLLDALASSDFDVRHAATYAIGNLGPVAASAVPALVAQMDPPEASLRLEAMKTLAKIGVGDALAAARAMLEDEENPRVRVWGELPVAQLRGDRALATPGIIEIVREHQSRRDADARADAAEALEVIGAGARAAMPLLEALLNDPERAPREAAKRAIHAITGEPLEGRLAPE